jgi:hypothetical protein
MATTRQSGRHEVATEATSTISRVQIDLAVVKEQAANTRRALEERFLEIKRLVEQQTIDTAGLHREHLGLRNEIALLRKELAYKRNADADDIDDEGGARSKKYRYAAGGAAGGGVLYAIVDAIVQALGRGG